MAKKKKSKSANVKAKPKAKAQTLPKKKAWAGSRGRVIKGGNREQPIHVAPAPESKVSIGEAMRLAVKDLGDVKIDAALAPSQMEELGACYEEVTRRRAAFDAKSDEAKTAKKGLEAATELLLDKVRSFTHPVSLPLFDQTQAEADLVDMTATSAEPIPNDPPAVDPAVAETPDAIVDEPTDDHDEIAF